MNLDQKLDRRGTNCWKWDGEGAGLELPMGCADMDFPMPGCVAEAINAKMAEGVLTYPVNDGGAFQAFADYFERHHGVAVNPAHIKYCFGMMCGYSLLIDALTNPGDEIIVQMPVFDYFMDTAENAGRRIVNNAFILDEETLRYSVDFDGLAELVARPRTKMMLICNPMNPTGMAFSKDDLRRIFELCAANDVLLLSDEVHSEFYWHGNKHVSLLELVPEVSDRCIVMAAPSKTFNIHGLYTSLWVMPNEDVRNAYAVEFNRRHMDLCDFGMIATKAVYENGDDYVREVRDYIEGNLEWVENHLATASVGVRMAPMDATYLIWLDFRAWGKTSAEINQLLRAEGLAISCGGNYGPGADGFMRMDIATQRANVERAFEIIEKVYAEHIA